MKKTILFFVGLFILSLNSNAQLVCDPVSPNLVSNPDMRVHEPIIIVPDDQALTNVCAWDKAVPLWTPPEQSVWLIESPTINGGNPVIALAPHTNNMYNINWAGAFQSINAQVGTTVTIDVRLNLPTGSQAPTQFIICLTNADVTNPDFYTGSTLNFEHQVLINEENIDQNSAEWQHITINNIHITENYSTLAMYFYRPDIIFESESSNGLSPTLYPFMVYVDWINLYQHELTVDAGENDEQCLGAHINIGGNPTAFGGVPGYTYSWSSFPVGFSSNQANPQITVDQTRTYSVTVIDHSIPPQIVSDYVTIVAVDCSLPNVLRVDASNPHIVANDGTSWDLAFTHLQDALTAASNNPEIDQIWIAEGTYYPDWNGSYHTGIRTDKFTMLEGVAIYGGFQGTEPSLEERSNNVEDFPTILSGNIMDQSSEIDNSKTIVSYEDITDGIVDRVTITDSFHKDGFDYESYAFDLKNSKVSVKDCSIVNNLQHTVGVSNSDVLFDACIFEKNQAEVVLECGGSNVVMTECQIMNNSVNSGVGGILGFGYSNLTMTSCIIEENYYYGEGGSGGLYLKICNATILDCNFIRNSALIAAQNAIVIMDHEETFSNYSKVLIKSCRFTQNGDGSDNLGGTIGIYLTHYASGANQTQVDIENCIFNNNVSRAFNTSNDGTAIQIRVIGDQTNDDYVNIKNNTFYNNQNLSQEYNGHEIFTLFYLGGSGENINVTNCILWDDQELPKIGTSDGSNLSVTYSDIKGGYGLLIDNNIDTDPFFADPLNGDFHLQSPNGRWDPDFGWVYTDTQCSPCIDAGDPASGGGGGTEPEIPNMGAYGNTSFQSKTCATTKSLLMASDESNSLSETFFDCFLSPNPISKSLKIELNLSNDSEVEVSIFDLMGRKSRTINSGYLTSGNKIMYWNCDDDANNELPNGIYLVVVKSNSTTKSFKVVIKR